MRVFLALLISATLVFWGCQKRNHLGNESETNAVVGQELMILKCGSFSVMAKKTGTKRYDIRFTAVPDFKSAELDQNRGSFGASFKPFQGGKPYSASFVKKSKNDVHFSLTDLFWTGSNYFIINVDSTGKGLLYIGLSSSTASEHTAFTDGQPGCSFSNLSNLD